MMMLILVCLERSAVNVTLPSAGNQPCSITPQPVLSLWVDTRGELVWIAIKTSPSRELIQHVFLAMLQMNRTREDLAPTACCAIPFTAGMIFTLITADLLPRTASHAIELTAPPTITLGSVLHVILHLVGFRQLLIIPWPAQLTVWPAISTIAPPTITAGSAHPVTALQPGCQPVLTIPFRSPTAALSSAVNCATIQRIILPTPAMAVTSTALLRFNQSMMESPI